MSGPPNSAWTGWGRQRLRALLAQREGADSKAPAADRCRTILAADGLAAMAEVAPELRSQWLERILTSQNPESGWFEESEEFSEESAREAAAGRTTALALQALDALGVPPRHRLAFVLAYQEHPDLTRWLEELDWSRPDIAADRISGLLAGFVYRAEVEGDSRARIAYHAVLDHLILIQDRRTGLWASAGQAGAPESIAAAHRIAPLFGYVRRPLRRVSGIIDIVLDSRSGTLGELGPDRGSTQALSEAGLLAACVSAGHREAQIRERLREIRDFVWGGRSPNGGSSPNDIVHPQQELVLLWTQLLTLAVVVPMLDDSVQGSPDSASWRFRRRPGPGCRVYGSALTDHERQVLPDWIQPFTPSSARSDRPSEAAPAVSVVIPCHDLGRYLPEALASVFAQTTRDFEVIVVDDGSTDEFTQLVLERLPAHGIRVLRQATAGVAPARNHGIQEGRGRYVCCLDPDDRIRPGFLARATEILDREEEIGLATGSVSLFDEREGISRFESCTLPELLAHNRVNTAAVFRKAAWQQVGRYRGGFSRMGIEDWDFWIRILEAGYRAAVIPEIVWEYRIRPNQMSDGLYDPDTWTALCRELMDRHSDSYRRHSLEIIEIVQRNWAKVRRYATEQDRGIAWWITQADWWRRASSDQEAIITELRGWASELERATAWWKAQAQDWQRKTEERDTRLAELEAWVEEVRRAQAWWEHQAANWERVAAECQAQIQALEARLRASRAESERSEASLPDESV